MISVHRRLEPRWIKLTDGDDREFKIRPLNSPEKIDVENEVTVKGRRVTLSGSGVMAACAGLLDWRGEVKDEHGNALPFSRANIEWLPVDTLGQLALRIYDNSKPSEQEVKNS